MVKYVRTEFRRSLASVHWMDPETKAEELF